MSRNASCLPEMHKKRKNKETTQKTTKKTERQKTEEDINRDGTMVSGVVLFLLTVASVCGRAAAEGKLVYVTVVSLFKICGVVLRFWFGETFTELHSKCSKFCVVLAYL